MNLQGWRYHVVGGDKPIENMMEDGLAIKKGLRDADIVVFSGGTDVTPTIYGEDGYHQLTQASDKERDRVETAIYHAAVSKRKVIVGICRGAQLVNVLNQGKLWQHVDNHTNCQHDLLYVNEKGERYLIKVTSDHHQMMIPADHGKIIGWTGRTSIKSTFHDDVPQGNEQDRDPEIVWYKRTKSLCFQPHPEWGLMSCKSLFFDCIKRVMIG
jgi:gamma-glutamyl-gamma-aminobutyrate hydrolase PuuD